MIKNLASIIFFFLSTLSLFSQTLDQHFNPIIKLPDYLIGVWKVKLQEDQKMVISGSFNYTNNVSTQGFARFYPDGSLDTTFNVGSGFDNWINCMDLQKDNKIVVGGYFEFFNNTLLNSSIVRLNNDGSLDKTFNPKGFVHAPIFEIVCQPDGKILASGSFRYSEVQANLIVRLNIDGSIDESFKFSLENDGRISKIIYLKDGKILVCGIFQNGDNSYGAIYRLNSDGTIDETFNAGKGDAIINSMDTLSNGKIIIGGDFLNFNGTSRGRVVCLNQDGSLNQDFYLGEGADGSVTNIFVEKDDKIFVMGYFSSYNGSKVPSGVRLNSNGTRDINFNFISQIYNIKDIQQQKDGKLLFTGYFSSYGNRSVNGIVRLNPNDAIADPIDFHLGRIGNVSKILKTSSDDLVITGSFESINGDGFNDIAKIINGNHFETFPLYLPNISFFNINNVLPDNDKYILIGYFSFQNGSYKAAVRINSDGSLDNSFNSPEVDFMIETKTFEKYDNKYLMVFTQFDYVRYRNTSILKRLNNNGSIDFSFPEIQANGEITSLKVLDENKIIIGGNYDSLNGVKNRYLTKINEDGSFVSSFPELLAANSIVETIELDENGKLLIGGILYTDKGSKILLRTSQAGVLDTSFNCKNTLIFKADFITFFKDYIAVGGTNTYSNPNPSHLFLINKDGSDFVKFKPISFSFIKDVSNPGLTSLISYNNSIYVGGTFNYVNNIPRSGLVEIQVPSLDQTISFVDIPNVEEGEKEVPLIANSTSSLPVKFSLVTGKGNINGDQISVKEAGNITIKAIQEGDSIYWPAAPITKSFCVLPTVPTVSIIETSKSIVLKSSSPYGNQWFFNGKKINGATSDTYLVQKIGNYSVEVSADNCSRESLSVSVTGKEEEVLKEQILRISPNPAYDAIQIQYNPIYTTKKLSIDIYNTLGAVVYHQDVSSLQNKWTKQFDLRFLTNGLYKMVLQDGKEKFIRGIIKL